MPSSRFQPADDGTLDTVILDSETGEEYRYSYDGVFYCADHDTEMCTNDECAEAGYDSFVDFALESTAEFVA